MPEQGAILFLNEDENIWELITTDDDGCPAKSWEVEAEALSDLAKDGWKIEGLFRMRPRQAGLPKIWFIGYGLKRIVQQSFTQGRSSD
jgi:hypothetical protein